MEEFERACRREQGPRTSPGVRLKENTLEWNGDRLEVPVRGAITSMAINATTVAITSALTHAIVFVALESEPAPEPPPLPGTSFS